VIKLRLRLQEHVTGMREMENTSYTKVLSENPRGENHMAKPCRRQKYNIKNHLQGLWTEDVGCDS
jgi:hypothetical protein